MLKIICFSALAPTAEPQSFEVTKSSLQLKQSLVSSSLQLKWEPPQEKLTHGIIRYYVIKFRVVDCSTGSSDAVWNITTVKSEFRNTTIGGLLFWTCYDVEIAAVTVGTGPFASKKKVRTSENGKLYFLLLWPFLRVEVIHLYDLGLDQTAPMQGFVYRVTEKCRLFH